MRAPQCAWIVDGSDASFPTITGSRFVDTDWTVPRGVRAGDLGLIYIVPPKRKCDRWPGRTYSAIHCLFRITSDPWWRPDLKPLSTSTRVGTHHYWANAAHFLPIEPIPFSVIKEICGGHLILHGPRGPLATAPANQLLDLARPLRRVSRRHPALQRVVGRDDLPPPDRLTWSDVRTLEARGRLLSEAELRVYVVDPLLRALRLPRAYRVKPEFAVGRRFADYVILREGRPWCVIEAKYKMDLRKDVAQVRGYAKDLGVSRMLLVDRVRVVAYDDRGPVMSVNAGHDPTAVRAFVIGRPVPDPLDALRALVARVTPAVPQFLGR
jgi:hypothetical protein